MKLKPFALERWFSEYEFSISNLLCTSDVESFSVRELLSFEEQSLDKLIDLRLGYTQSSGDPSLKEQIIRSVYPNTILSTKHLLVHCGAQEAIFNFFACPLFEKGDSVIVQFPCYSSLSECPQISDCEVIKWEGKEHEEKVSSTNQFWSWDINQLEELRNEKTKALVVNSPHNPTGYLFTRDEFDQILNFCRKYNLYLFSDEVYRGLELNPEHRLPSAAEVYENAVSLGVMSKSYGLAGLRIGWIASQNSKVIDLMKSQKDYTSICCSAPSEFLANIALRNSEVVLKRNLDLIQENLSLVDSFFNKYQEYFKWNRPIAGSIAFVGMTDKLINLIVLKHPQYNQKETKKDSWSICSVVAIKGNVLLLPSEVYEFGSRHFRLGYGRADLKNVLGEFSKFIDSLLN